MTAPFELNDDSVVVIIGTGAGGGVLANELAQKGISVVALEAGGRYFALRITSTTNGKALASWPGPMPALRRATGVSPRISAACLRGL